jgi:hypothetical protein
LTTSNGLWRPCAGRDERKTDPAAHGRGTAVLPIPFSLVTISRQPIQYKGDELDPERGPGLGCFRFQLGVLVFLIVLTPLTVAWQWPVWLSSVLLFAVILLLLVAGQTIIFLLRLVAANRRTRRRPLGGTTKTVGELDDAETTAPTEQPATPDDEPASSRPTGPPATPDDEGPVRQ